MTYDILGESALDYLPCRYGASRLLFRGPKKNLDEPYIAFLGGTETYGKFIEHPFVNMVEDQIDLACANFGCLNAGVDVFLHDPFITEATQDARVTVIQVTGAQNMTNRMYTVHPRRNDRFVGPTNTLRTLYRDVDFSNFHFNKHLVSHLRAMGQQRFEMVRAELSEAWVARMRTMLGNIRGKKVLLWFSQHRPEDSEELLDNDPFMVNRAMLDRLSDHVIETVEVVPSQSALNAGTEGMTFTQLEEPAAQEMLSIAAHREVADALVPVLRSLV